MTSLNDQNLNTNFPKLTTLITDGTQINELSTLATFLFSSRQEISKKIIINLEFIKVNSLNSIQN